MLRKNIKLITNIKYFIYGSNTKSIILIFALLTSLCSLFFFIANRTFLIGSDAFYYMAIADSLLQSGEFKDITEIPSIGVKTPQNGVVLIHIVLSLLGISPKGHIYIIVILNYALYVSAVYPLYKIGKSVGLKTESYPLLALISVYLGAWHIYRINLLAINDGIFNSLILWTVYLIIEFVQQIDDSSFSRNNSINFFKKYSIIFMFVVVSFLFRLNIALVLISAVLSCFLTKKYKASAMLLVIIGCVVLLFYLVISSIEIRTFTRTSLSSYYKFIFGAPTFYEIKLQLWKIIPRLLLGIRRINNPIAISFFMIFPLTMIYYGIRGIIQKSFIQVFIAGICLSGLWFTLNFQNARIIWYTIPFIYLIILDHKFTRYLGYIFVLVVFLFSLRFFYWSFQGKIGRSPSSKLFSYMFDNSISLPIQNQLLLTNRARHTYFLLNTRSYRVSDPSDGILDGKITFPEELNWDSIISKGSQFVLGDSTYINNAYSQVHEMAESNGYDLESKPFTPDLDEFEGWALVELKPIMSCKIEN